MSGINLPDINSSGLSLSARCQIRAATYPPSGDGPRRKFILLLDQTKSLVYNKNKLNNALKRGEIVGIGRKIAEVRKQKGLTQKYIATKMNRTYQWLSNIEREERSISADVLAQVANILEVSPSVFFNKELDETSKTHKTCTE